MEQYLKEKYYQITNGKQLNIDFKNDPIKQLKLELNYFKSFVSTVKEYCENKGFHVNIYTEQKNSDKGYISKVILNQKVVCQGTDLIKKISREIACEKFIQKYLKQDSEVDEEDLDTLQGDKLDNNLDFSKLDSYDPLVNYITFLQMFQNYSKLPNFTFRFQDKQGENEVVDFVYKDLKVQGIGITKFHAKNQATFKMLSIIQSSNEFKNFMKNQSENQNSDSKKPNAKTQQRKQRKQRQKSNHERIQKKQKCEDLKFLVIDVDSQKNKTNSPDQKKISNDQKPRQNDEIQLKDKQINNNSNDKIQKESLLIIENTSNNLAQTVKNDNNSQNIIDQILFNEDNPNQTKHDSKMLQNQSQENKVSLKSETVQSEKQVTPDKYSSDLQKSKQPIVVQDDDDDDSLNKNCSSKKDKPIVFINLDLDNSQKSDLKIISEVSSTQQNQVNQSNSHEKKESSQNQNAQNKLDEKKANNQIIYPEIKNYLDQKLFKIPNSAIYSTLTQQIFENLAYNSISQETYNDFANIIDSIDVFNQECQLGVLCFQIVGSLYYKIIFKEQVVGDIVILCDASLTNLTEEKIREEIFKKIKSLSNGSKVQQYFNCMSLKSNQIKLKFFIEFVEDKLLSLRLHHWNYMELFHQSILKSQPIKSIFMAVRRLRSFYQSKIDICVLDALILFVTKQLQFIEPSQNLIDLINFIIQIDNYSQIDNLIVLDGFMEFHKQMILKDFNELKILSSSLKDLSSLKIFDFLNSQQISQENLNKLG